MLIDGIDSAQVHEQFWNHGLIGNEVGQGDIFAREQATIEIVGPLAAVKAVTGNLRSAQQGGLERRSARGDQGGAGMMYQRIGGIAQHYGIIVAHHLSIEAVIDAGGCSNDGLIVGMARGGLEHQGKIVADFAHTRTRHQGDDGTVGEAIFFDEMVIIGEVFTGQRHLLHRGVADVGRLIAMVLVPVGFKGQDAIHVVDIATDVLDAPFLPHPHLGRDEIVDGNAQVVGILGDLEIERRIVHQNHSAWLPLIDGTARGAQEPEDFPQVPHHVGKAHIGHVAVVDDGLHTRLGCHEVTAQEAELGLRVLLLEGGYQVRGMQVARSLAGNDEIFHGLRRFRVIKSNS